MASEEQARGRRAVGETATARLQRTVPATVTQVWKLITSRPELWLGAGVTFDKGERYAVSPAGGTLGAHGEIRVVKPGDRLRMTLAAGWLAGAGDRPAHRVGLRPREDRPARAPGDAAIR